MEIIAKTRDGVLIQASEREVNEILNAVSGKAPDKLSIGQKIPAIDYASTITKVKALGDTYAFKALVERCKDFANEVEQLKTSVCEANEITI